MAMNRRVTLALAATAVLTVGVAGGVSVAAGGGTTASCTPSPLIEDTADGQKITVECTVPKPPPATVTIAGPTVTVTATPSPTVNPSATAQPSNSGTPSPTSPASPPPSKQPTMTPGDGVTPAPDGFPDEATTGVPDSLALKRVPRDVTSGPGWRYDSRGWITVYGSGAVFSGYRTSANIDVTSPNATIKNNLIELSRSNWGITLRHTNGVTIDHNTITGASFTNPGGDGIRGIYGDDDNVTITNNEIKWCLSGINHLNRGGLIEGNYIHDMGSDAGGAHINGVQLGAGDGSLMTIRRNTILNELAQTDAIMLANDDGAQRNRVITGNLIGGGGYTFYGSGSVSGSATGITFTDNQITTRFFPRGGYWGPVAYWKASGNVWSGNTWADGSNAGKPINP